MKREKEPILQPGGRFKAINFISRDRKQKPDKNIFIIHSTLDIEWWENQIKCPFIQSLASIFKKDHKIIKYSVCCEVSSFQSTFHSQSNWNFLRKMEVGSHC